MKLPVEFKIDENRVQEWTHLSLTHKMRMLIDMQDENVNFTDYVPLSRDVSCLFTVEKTTIHV